MPEDRLRQAHAVCLEKGYADQAEIIGSYIEEIYDNERDKKGTGLEGSANRSRSPRGVRAQKGRTLQAQERTRAPLCENQPNEQSLFSTRSDRMALSPKTESYKVRESVKRSIKTARY